MIEINASNVRAYYGLYLLDTSNFSENNFNILLNLKNKKQLNLYEEAIINYLLSKQEKKKKQIEKEIKFLNKFHKNIYDFNFSYNNSSQFYYNKIINKHFNKIKIINDSKNFLKFNNIHPIFIIGLPRSGSTVIESILTSAKEKIISHGESHVFNMSILDQVAPKIYSVDFDENKFEFEIDYKKLNEKVSNQYSKLIFEKDYKNYRFIDKSLENFFNIEIIYNIFPNAKFLHTFRNIPDSIISIHQAMLPELSWSHSIENILEYVNNYLKILNYFKIKYPNLILDVNLENFTFNTEEIAKKIIKFSNLTWNKKILDFYQRKDLFSKTLSFSQIRSKVEKYDDKKYKSYYDLFKDYKHMYKWLEN